MNTEKKSISPELQEALDFIEESSWLGSRPGLERICQLTALLGNPQDDLHFVHIAGTNGKGSTAAMLASIFTRSGYKTGLFTSPHLHRYSERIQINGQEITDAAFCAAARRTRDAVRQMSEPPTEFERLTAMALSYFQEEHCDIIIWETGMGGRLDSTNIITKPDAVVITHIGMDHMEYLGASIPEIAAEKAGIIKPGCDVILYGQDRETEAVIQKYCTELHCTCVISGKPERIAQDLRGQIFSYRSRENMPLHLLGSYQLENAAVALDCMDRLKRHGWNISESAIRDGLANVSWPGRLEVLHQKPLFLLDGAHNPQCAAALAESLRELPVPVQNISNIFNISDVSNTRKFIFILGVLEDKDYKQMIALLAPLAECFFCLTPDSPRALPAEKLAAYLQEQGFSARAYVNISQAVSDAAELAGKNGAIVSCGSLYLAGAVRDAVRCFNQADNRTDFSS